MRLRDYRLYLYVKFVVACYYVSAPILQPHLNIYKFQNHSKSLLKIIIFHFTKQPKSFSTINTMFFNTKQYLTVFKFIMYKT